MSDETKTTEEVAAVPATTEAVKKEETPEAATTAADAATPATDAAPAADATADAPADKAEEPESEVKKEEDDENTKSIVSAFTERLQFFFSNANLRQDKWMRTELYNRNSLPLDSLLRFQTIKKISTDKTLLGRAAAGEDVELGERLKKLIAYDSDKQEIRRVVRFDSRTMGDGSSLSLYVKNVPLTQPPKKEEETEKMDEDKPKEEDKKEEEKSEEKSEAKKETDDAEKMEVDKPVKKERNSHPNFRPRYAVTRDEIKALFEPYGHVGIVQLRFSRKQPVSSNDRYTNPANRGGYNNRGVAEPLGVAIVEFEDQEGLDKACEELLIRVDDRYKKEGDEKKEEDDNKNKKELEIKGNTLVIEKMGKDVKNNFFDQDGNPSTDSNNNKNNKRDRDNKDNGKDEEDDRDAKVEFEPVTLDWHKGCVISLEGLSAAECSRESIRDAVSDILGVTTDVKTSGLYVDYSRGDSDARLRLNDPKPAEMKELVEKLTSGDITVSGEKVGSAKILEGEVEEKYWNDFIGFLNNRKKMREEEKFHARKRQKRNGGGGRGRGGRGGGGRGYMGRGRGGGGRGRGRR